MADLYRANLVGLALVLAWLAVPACRCDRSEPADRCADRGTVYLADVAAEANPEARLRATHGGCEPCPRDLRRGAGPGSPCEAPGVCGEVCCPCPNSARFFTVSACTAGVCATRKNACRAAIGRFGETLCGD